MWQKKLEIRWKWRQNRSVEAVESAADAVTASLKLGLVEMSEKFAFSNTL
jgi:hypothetical protein